MAEDDRPASQISADISSEITKHTGGSYQVKSKQQVAEQAIQSIELPQACYPTQLPSLDNAMGGGLYAGFTYGIGGPEKAGKTTFAHTISYNLNESEVPHAYIALEMGSLQIEQRNIARKIGCNSLVFRQRGLDDDDHMKQKILHHTANVKPYTWYLDMPGSTIQEIEAELARLVIKQKISGFILDYWQLVGGRSKGDTEERHLREVAQWCANFARRHNIWCILLAQLNDNGELFGGKGLKKACDQLYYIRVADDGKGLYLQMNESRYTPACDVGDSVNPAFRVNVQAGPHIMESY